MGDMRERMLRGEVYLANDPELVEAHARAADLLFRLNGTSNAERAARSALLTSCLAGSAPRPPSSHPSSATTAPRSRSARFASVNAGAVCSTRATVTIGDDVQIGPNVQLLTATHPTDAAELAGGAGASITIGSGAWLGGGVIIGPA